MTKMEKYSKEIWMKKLSVIKPEEWESMKENYKSIVYERGESYEEEWWNNKFYVKSENNDGFQLQKYKYKGQFIEEIPFRRKLGHPSSNRFGFGLEQNPVTYLARSWVTATCETIDQFRDDLNLSDHDINLYISGRTVPNPDHYGYPITVYFKANTTLLNLTNVECKFFKLVEEYGLWRDASSFFEEVIIERNEEIYPITHAIAEYAFKHGFNGIKYTSVRRPQASIIIDPEDCIALYNDENLSQESSLLNKKELND